MTFALDFAPHLGFPTPATPLFAELVGSADPVRNLEFAARQGFRRVQDPFAVMRDEAEQARIGAAAKANGLQLGCLVYAPLAIMSDPIWSRRGREAGQVIDRLMADAIAMAGRIGADRIAILTGRDAGASLAEQIAAFAANLARAAAQVADQGMVLLVESVSAHRLPQMLLHHLDQAMAVVEAADHPAVRLIFDTGHIAAMDGDVLVQIERCWHLIDCVQIANSPLRTEPTPEGIDFTSLIHRLVERGFSGPCELEHGWSLPGRTVQQAYLDWLQNWRMPQEEGKCR